jgi:hypothetical protein
LIIKIDFVKFQQIIFIIICQIEPIKKETSEFLNPTVVAALIAALVTLSSVYLSYRTLSIQRLQSERNEIYKKLNDFYGPMRLLLRNSDELYKLFSSKIINRTPSHIEFRTLPYILEGNSFDKTEKALFVVNPEQADPLDRC